MFGFPAKGCCPGEKFSNNWVWDLGIAPCGSIFHSVLPKSNMNKYQLVIKLTRHILGLGFENEKK
jgi:hypothetical protein